MDGENLHNDRFFDKPNNKYKTQNNYETYCYCFKCHLFDDWLCGS